MRGDIVAKDHREPSRREREAARRKHRETVGREQIVDRLVDSPPVIHEIAEALTEQGGVRAKLLHDRRPACRAEATQVRRDGTTGARDRARVRDPDRVREMMDRDERMDPERAKRFELAPVVCQRCFVDLILHRLDPSPLDREPVAIDAEIVDQPDVFDRSGVAAHRLADER